MGYNSEGLKAEGFNEAVIGWTLEKLYRAVAPGVFSCVVLPMRMMSMEGSSSIVTLPQQAFKENTSMKKEVWRFSNQEFGCKEDGLKDARRKETLKKGSPFSVVNMK